MSNAIEVLREFKSDLDSLKDCYLTMENRDKSVWLGRSSFTTNKIKEAIDKALLALGNNDCVEFGYWLVNAPNRELYSKKWVEQKYQQYLKEKKVV